MCIRDRQKGVQKHPVEQISLQADWGIVGDAHAGPWHRQVSLLAQESVDNLQSKISLQLKPGDFAENILTKGIVLYQLQPGTKLRIGTALAEVTQIGKTCHQDCAIRQTTGCLFYTSRCV